GHRGNPVMDRRGSRLSRREFVLGAGMAGLGLMGCGRLPGQAQPAPRVPRIAYLTPSSPQPWDESFRGGLRDLGYIEGQNVVVQSGYGEGSPARLQQAAAEALQFDVDVVVAVAESSVRAARAVSSSVPIVVFAGDAVAQGLVTNLARPDNNITG